MIDDESTNVNFTLVKLDEAKINETVENGFAVNHAPIIDKLKKFLFSFPRRFSVR